jgi:hypothetical protein
MPPTAHRELAWFGVVRPLRTTVVSNEVSTARKKVLESA